MCRLLVALLLVAAVVRGADGVCCKYPLTNSIFMKSVYENEFKCSEPMNFTCTMFSNNPDIVACGVLGNQTEMPISPEFLVKTMEPIKDLKSTITCDTTVGLWKINDDPKNSQWNKFSCAFKRANGDWIVPS